MPKVNDITEPSSAHWDKYWGGNQDTASFGEGGVNHPLLESFWKEYFSQSLALNPECKILDIASGTGAVLVAGGLDASNESVSVSCVDSSAHALATLKTHFPKALTLESDIGDIPLDDGSFNLVTSQFGVEYAGLEAVNKISKFVGPEGRLVLVLHHNRSSIFTECSNSATAIHHLLKGHCIPLAITMFKAGFSMLGGTDPSEFKEAGRALMPAFKSLEPLMDRYGIEVAGGTIVTFYNKVAEIQKNLNKYIEHDVIDWLEKLLAEMPAYIARMESMCEASLSPEDFKDFCNKLQEDGFRLLEARALRRSGIETPIAWILASERIVKE